MIASPLRYFIVMRLQPNHNLAVLGGIAVVGLWTVAMSAGELDSALGMLLFVQMFLASTAFVARARRGHFDPVLTSGSTRLVVFASHWLVSVLPGLLAWGIVCGVDWVFGGGVALSALLGHRLLALAIVSAIAWTAGFSMTRGAAGALWTAGLVAVLLHRSDLLGSTSVSASSFPVVLRHAAAVLVCPFLLLGNVARLAPASIPTAVCAAVLALLSAWSVGNRMDFYLRDRA